MRVETNFKELSELLDTLVHLMGRLRKEEFENIHGINVLETQEYTKLEYQLLTIVLRDDSTGTKDIHKEIVRKRYKGIGVNYKSDNI